MSARDLPPLVRLGAACTWRSWRWVPPSLVLVASLLVIYTVQSGKAIAAYALAMTLMVPVTAWLVAAAGNADDGAHQRLLAAASTRPLLHASRAAVGLLLALPLIVAATAYPWALGFVTAPPGAFGSLRTLLLGLAAHLVGACCGVAVGTFTHRPLLVRTGGAVVVGAAGTMAAVFALLPLLRALAHDRPGALAVAVPAAAAVALVAVAAAGRLSSRAA